jgi:Predicted transcriptional regulators
MQTTKLRLKAARAQTGLTQEAAAKALGISQNTLQKYEAGITTPDVLRSYQIAKLYSFDINDIDWTSGR